MVVPAEFKILWTGFLKPNQIVICFLVAFFKGLFISWAEFLVGLALIQTARQDAKNATTSGVTNKNNSGGGVLVAVVFSST